MADEHLYNLTSDHSGFSSYISTLPDAHLATALVTPTSFSHGNVPLFPLLTSSPPPGNPPASLS